MIHQSPQWRTFPRSIQRILQLAWQAAPRISFASIVISTIQAILPVAVAWLLKLLLDEVALQMGTSGAMVVQTLLWIVIAYVAVSSLQSLLSPIDNYFKEELRRSLGLHVRNEIYRQTLSFEGIAYLEDPQYHDLQSVSTEQVQTAPFIIANSLTGIVQSTVAIVSFIGLLLVLSPMLAGVVLLSVVPHLLVQLRFGRNRVSLTWNLSPLQRESQYLSFVLTGLEAAREVRLFGLQTYLLDKWRNLVQRSNSAESELERRELRSKLLLELLALGAKALAFYFIVLGVLNRQLTVGDIALYNGAVIGVQTGVLSFAQSMAQMAEVHLFFTQYETLRTMPQPIEVTETPQTIEPLTEAITFEDVWFRYGDGMPWVLQGVSFELPVHQCVALVGINGAGKTTLIKLITRLYDPTRGRILWDGVDIREFAVDHYRERLSTVFQNFTRYQLSVHENIGLGNVTQMSARADVENAAQRAGIAERVEELDNGYDTRLSRWLSAGEQGTDLSGGEWQRIAIARSFMRDSDLLLLDEPTSALDAETEWRIVRLFEQLKQERTTLLISHRFSTIKLADQVVVLEDGKIVESGTHRELVAVGNVYARMYNAQAELYENSVSETTLSPVWAPA